MADIRSLHDAVADLIPDKPEGRLPGAGPVAGTVGTAEPPAPDELAAPRALKAAGKEPR